MKILFYLLIVIFTIIVIILIIGVLLPSERKVIRQSVLSASPEAVYEIVTNNKDWAYRSDLQQLNIISNNNGIEEWDEITKDGATIRFKTRDKNPYTFYSFDMESNLFTGYWTAEFKDAGTNKTLFVATENIKMKNIFLKVLSYLFFDIGKFMETYQNDLKKRVEEDLK